MGPIKFFLLLTAALFAIIDAQCTPGQYRNSSGACDYCRSQSSVSKFVWFSFRFAALDLIPVGLTVGLAICALMVHINQAKAPVNVKPVHLVQEASAFTTRSRFWAHLPRLRVCLHLHQWVVLAVNFGQLHSFSTILSCTMELGAMILWKSLSQFLLLL